MAKERRKRDKKKRVLTYEEEHNLHYGRFQRSSHAFLWAAIINVIGLIVTIVQATQGQTELSFYINFASCDLIFRSLALIPYFNSGGEWLYIILIILVAALFSGLAIWLSVTASQGKIKLLWLELILYVVDLFVVLPCYFFFGEAESVLWAMFILHAIVIFFMVWSLYEYYRIKDLAIQHGRLKEESEEQENDVSQ